jgi:hypothetical protein
MLSERDDILLPLAKAALEIWNGGLAFGACPTQSSVDALGKAVSRYVTRSVK